MEKVKFSRPETDYLVENEVCRVATCKNDVPHVVPVSYIFKEGLFYFAADYGTKKLKNIMANDRVALTVDTYSATGNKAICIQGRAQLVETGSEFTSLYDIFYRRFEWVRDDPWKPGEAPFVKVIPFAKVSWGIE